MRSSEEIADEVLGRLALLDEQDKRMHTYRLRAKLYNKTVFVRNAENEPKEVSSNET